MSRPPRDAGKRVAIVVPLSSQPSLLPDEEISLQHLRHFLGAFDTFAIAAEGATVPETGFELVRFPATFFGSAAAQGHLMLSPTLYERFADYEYILTYHPDALVFSDRLLEWCDLGYDFIGGPWRDVPSGKLVVGNGGFALRRVESFLRFVRSDDYAVDPDEYWARYRATHTGASLVLNYPRKYLKRLKVFNSVRREIRANVRQRYSDDTFLADAVHTMAPWFRIAPLDVALRFSFDNAPRTCFELTGGVRPFGCHGWFKSDRDFWVPYLLPSSEPDRVVPA